MTYEEQEKRRAKERKKWILVHSIAEEVTKQEDITFIEAIQVLERAKNLVETNMKKQRATIEPEIRDGWGTIIGVSRTETSDMKI